jgi:uncharacterized membrane protein
MTRRLGDPIRADQPSLRSSGPPRTDPERDIAVVSSFVLRAGVIVSALLTLGDLITALRGRVSLHQVRHHALAMSVPTILREAVHGQGFALMEAGLLVLVITPLLRVAVSLVLFGRHRDWLFMGLTAAVLALVVGSLILLR